MAGKRNKANLQKKKISKVFTHLGTNLVAALACLQVNNLTHLFRSKVEPDVRERRTPAFPHRNANALREVE